MDFLILTGTTPMIISLKTSMRERYLQDAYLDNVWYITLDKIEAKNVCYIDEDKLYLTRFVENLKQMTKFKVLDLFCGAGGFTQGFQDSGAFEVVCGIDNWQVAIDTYAKNFGHSALCRDLTTYTPEHFVQETSIKEVDILIGGPPCQGFSIAGKRDTKDPRNSLFMAFVSYLNYFKPKAFYMENVYGILSMKTDTGEKCVDIILKELSTHYRVIILKLSASDYEVPQKRRRVIFFGLLSSLNIEPTNMTHSYPEIPVARVLDMSTEHASYVLSERALQGIIERKHKMVQEGKGFGAQVLDLSKPSYTIPARYWKDGYDALVPLPDGKLRRLMLNELASIQTFPSHFIFTGNKKDQIIQIGNAVACKFAYHLALHMAKHLEEPIVNIKNLTVRQLKILCKERELKGYTKLKKHELINLLS